MKKKGKKNGSRLNSDKVDLQIEFPEPFDS